MARPGENDYRKLWHQAVAERDKLRALVVEADSFISHKFHRGVWPGGSFAVDQLIARLREAGKPA